MRKIGTYLRSFWQSIKDKPFVFIIFIVSIMLSVMVSAYAYRITKREIKDFNGKAYYDIEYVLNFDEMQFYNLTKNSNITDIRQQYTISEKTEIEGEDKVTFYQNEYLPQDDVFSRDELDDGQNIAIVSEGYSIRENKNVGNTVEVFGQTFEIVRVTARIGNVSKSQAIVYVPATAEIVFEKNQNALNMINFCTKGSLKNKTAKAFKNAGIDAKLDTPAINTGVILGVSIGLILMSLASLNIFVANKFIADKNSKRYSLYRVVGAKNRDVAAVMVIESLLVLAVAFCLGALVEHFAIKPGLGWDAFASLRFVDYLAILFLNAFAVIVTTGIVIFKKLYFAPMDGKQRGKQ